MKHEAIDETSRVPAHFRARWAAAVLAALACAAAGAQEARPVVANVPAPTAAQPALEPRAVLNPPTAVPAVPASNTILVELRELVENKQLAELRTTYNGQYGASLLFKADDLTYYVALFQQRQFWRATKTRDHARAEELYRGLVRQTETLAEVDIERIRLDAERAYTESRIEREAAELDALRGNLAFQRQRDREVAMAQEQARQQAQALAAQQDAARERLEALQKSIEALQAEQDALTRDILQTSATPVPEIRRR